ncbi:MAG: hypothetical protein ACK53Y_20395, partial [bacterium]
MNKIFKKNPSFKCTEDPYRNKNRQKEDDRKRLTKISSVYPLNKGLKRWGLPLIYYVDDHHQHRAESTVLQSSSHHPPQDNHYV